LVPSVLSAIQMIQDNNFQRNVERIVQQNKNMGKSYIYDYKTDVEANPPTVDLYMAGEKMESISRERLFQEAEEVGITRGQITIHEDAAFQFEQLSESELIQSIIDGHNQQVDALERKVEELSGELQSYKNRELPSELLTRELSAQYDGVLSVTLTRGKRVQTEGGEGSEVIVAILHTRRPVKEADRLRIRNWLQVRLGVEEVDVIVNSDRK
ncbi:MAG: hypothetical protein IJR36_07670, partial [Lachnospiraceae bacterium]|nr:hypothetical protein [Lachnospiraceae bacterium]